MTSYNEYLLTTSATPGLATAIDCAVKQGLRAFIFANAGNMAAISIGTTSDAACFSIGPGAYFEIPGVVNFTAQQGIDVSKWWVKSTAAAQTFRVLIY